MVAGPVMGVQAKSCHGGNCRKLWELRKQCYCLHISLLILKINGVWSLVPWFLHQNQDEPCCCCLLRLYFNQGIILISFIFCVFLSVFPCPSLVVWTAGQMMVSTWLSGCSMGSSAYGIKMARRKWRSSGQGALSPPYGPSVGTLQGDLIAILLLEQILLRKRAFLPRLGSLFFLKVSIHSKPSHYIWPICFGSHSTWMEFFKSPFWVLEWIPEILAKQNNYVDQPNVCVYMCVCLCACMLQKAHFFFSFFF